MCGAPAAFAQKADGSFSDLPSADHAASVGRDVESQRYVGSASSAEFGASSQIAEFSDDVRIEGGGRAVKVRGSLIKAGRTRVEATAAFFSYSAMNDSSSLPWMMANPQLVASTTLDGATEGHVSLGVLHAVQSGKVVSALTDESTSALNDPALRGRLWNTFGVGASHLLSRYATVRAELCLVLNGLSLAQTDGTIMGAPVVLTLGVVFL